MTTPDDASAVGRAGTAKTADVAVGGCARKIGRTLPRALLPLLVVRHGEPAGLRGDSARPRLESVVERGLSAAAEAADRAGEGGARHGNTGAP